MTLIGGTILAFMLDGIASMRLFNESIFETLSIIIYITVIAVACFFICKKYPKSVWYTPIICNGLVIFMIIMGALFYPTSHESSEKSSFGILVLIDLALSVLEAIFGARIGRRKINQE